MHKDLKFCLLAGPMLVVVVPLLGLMASASGLMLCSLLVALLSASLSHWSQRRAGFWVASLLCASVPAGLYGLFMVGYVQLRNISLQAAASASTAGDLLLFFLLNGLMVLLGMLAGLLLWQRLLGRRPSAAMLNSPILD